MHGKGFTSNRNGRFHHNSFKKQNQVKFFKKKPTLRDSEHQEIQQLLNEYDRVDFKKAETFAELPLSKKTKLGLKKSGYFRPSEIQRDTIGLALKGCDILGAAKTGSGKTLAFLIPVLEKLYHERWTNMDGLGALVITPTRELAYQIFEVLRVVGSNHDFSAGLIIGGKDLHFERHRMDKCNIVICTPGRLLQHMDENPLFDPTSLKVLVLDEADRILDLGFQQTMNAIIDNLPVERQTLLFSATQTKSVKDLARLSLKDPEYVSVHENSKYSTPEALSQSYMVCELHEKMDFLWSFIRGHRKQKILVFLSSCKQVKYTYDVFCRMRPGLSVLALYGSLHQLRRMAIYDDFCRKQTAVLLATDIASRGLDFPSVNWVVHLDCPEDVNTYIHRAGRTARYEEDGQSLLVLLPSEEKAMIEQLEGRKIPLQQTQVSQLKYISVQRKMEALCARDVKLKESAQRAFVAYLKSVFLMKDKSVFVIQNLDIDAYARSLGLAVSPRVRFLQKHLQKLERKETKKGRMQSEKFLPENTPSGGPVKTPQNQRQTFNFQTNTLEDNSDNEDGFLTVKRVIMPTGNVSSDSDSEDLQEAKVSKPKVVSKAAVARKLAKKKIKVNKKIIFNEEGQETEGFPKEQKSEIARKLLHDIDEQLESGLNLDLAKKIMEEEDKIDKKLFRQRIKELHKEKKRKFTAERTEFGDEKNKKCKKNDGHDSVGSEGDHDGDFQLAEYIEALPDPDQLQRNRASRKKENRTRSPGEKKTGKVVEKKSKSLPKDTGLSLQADEELALHILTAGE